MTSFCRPPMSIAKPIRKLRITFRSGKSICTVRQRSSIFHEPDPANPLPAYKRNNRRVYLELNVEQPDLRIIDDEKFHQVGKIIDERMFNKNGGSRRMCK